VVGHAERDRSIRPPQGSCGLLARGCRAHFAPHDFDATARAGCVGASVDEGNRMLGLLEAELGIVGDDLGIASPAGFVALPLALLYESLDRTALREIVPSGLVYGTPFTWLRPRGSGDPRWNRGPTRGRGSCWS
jgi:hypothetical protein